MNRRKLNELKDKWVRLRPIPRRFNTAGIELEQSDHAWLVIEADRSGVTVKNVHRGGHILPLAADQIRGFRTDIGELIRLSDNVWVRGRDAGVDPLIYRRRRSPHERVRTDMQTPAQFPVVAA